MYHEILTPIERSAKPSSANGDGSYFFDSIMSFRDESDVEGDKVDICDFQGTVDRKEDRIERWRM